MKLIVDIPKELVEEEHFYTEEELWTVIRATENGIPLDDVKEEIAEEICLTDNPYTKETKYTIEHLKLLEILDNIGKAESEEE